MANAWYFKAENKIIGPVDDSQLKIAVTSGAISRSSRVRLGEEGPWGPASLVSGLFSATTTVPSNFVAADELIELQDDLLAELEIDPRNVAAPVVLAPAKPRSPKSTPTNQWSIAAAIAGGLATILVLISSLVWFLASGSTTDEAGDTADNPPRPISASSVAGLNQPPPPADASAPAALLEAHSNSKSSDKNPSAQSKNSLPTRTASKSPLRQEAPRVPASRSTEEHQGKLDLVDVVAKVERSVVRVDTDSTHGSGVVVDDGGAVLTSFHVIEGAKRVVVGLRSGKQLESRGYLAVDRLHDLAVIAIEKLDEGTAIKISGN